MKNIVLLLAFILTTTAFANVNDEVKNLLEVEKQTIHVYHQVVPSVVNVSNIKVADDFFYGRVEMPQGAGTGFVWDNKGHIVTNFHVVQGGDNFIISFYKDQKQYKATVVGVAPTKDIAVLKLTEIPSELTPVTPGSSKDLLVGQIAMALGNPFGLDQSLSKGIISALGRKIDGIGGFKIHDMIQTDAAINQGNSGGPLLNSKGELIGMNTMIFSTSGSSSGLGFAVPVDTIKEIVPQLIEHGKVIRPVLGVNILSDQQKEMYFPKTPGAILTYVDPALGAGLAGLKGMRRDRFGRNYQGDVILKINGTNVNTKDDIFQMLEKFKVGDTIDIEYKRDGKTKTTKVKLSSF